MLKILLTTIVCAAVSTASAAIIYLPVRYEYGGSDKYYYGGSDPAVFARAERATRAQSITRAADPVNVPARTYTDALPYQPNAAVFGFTANDARLEAYRAVPRYFRMTDVLPAGRVDSDGPIVMPAASPGTIEIKPYVRPVPGAATRPILILPKSIPNKPA